MPVLAKGTSTGRGAMPDCNYYYTREKKEKLYKEQNCTHGHCCSLLTLTSPVPTLLSALENVLQIQPRTPPGWACWPWSSEMKLGCVCCIYFNPPQLASKKQIGPKEVSEVIKSNPSPAQLQTCPAHPTSLPSSIFMAIWTLWAHCWH